MQPHTLEAIDSANLEHVTGGINLKGMIGGAMGLLGWGDESLPKIDQVQPNVPGMSRTMEPPRMPPGPGGVTVPGMGGGGGIGGGGSNMKSPLGPIGRMRTF